MTDLIAEMLKEGLIKPSNNPYSSPVLLVKKKDGTWRFCVDYQALNAITIRDRFPIPTVDELLDELHGARVFSRLIFEPVITKFTSMKNDIFRDVLRRFVLVFFDDILIYSPTHEQHYNHLCHVFSILTKHIKIKAIQEWPKPTSITGLCGFLGLTGYYSRFVQGYAHIAAPLTDLLQNKQIQWNDEAEEAFQSLKTALNTLSVLALPDFTLIFDVTTDASAVKKWRQYLLGSKFRVFTDQRSLKHLLTQVMQNLGQHKWAVKLLGYDFEVYYKPGKENRVVDALIRIEKPQVFAFSWMQELRDYYLHNSEGKKLLERFSSQPTTLPDGQTEVVNRCLESYLRCFACDEPTSWSKYLYLAKFWYNTSYHSAIEMAPFQALYGRPPPSIPHYTLGSSQVASIDTTLMEHQRLISLLKETLQRTRQRMTEQANKHRMEKEFEVGDMVYLSLRIYRQSSVAKRDVQKLSKRYFGPFKVLERIGKVAYRLELPPGSRIHPTFHVYLLRSSHGNPNPSNLPLPMTYVDDIPVLEPKSILDHRINKRNGSTIQQVLVKWMGRDITESTWENQDEIHIPGAVDELEDKVIAIKGRLWMPSATASSHWETKPSESNSDIQPFIKSKKKKRIHQATDATVEGLTPLGFPRNSDRQVFSRYDIDFSTLSFGRKRKTPYGFEMDSGTLCVSKKGNLGDRKTFCISSEANATCSDYIDNSRHISCTSSNINCPTKETATHQHLMDHVCVQPEKAFVLSECPLQKKAADKVNYSKKQQAQANDQKICMVQTDVVKVFDNTSAEATSRTTFLCRYLFKNHT
nr:Ty3/gypsy retrotransposon protein [Tanacetum cinerariifolium]